MTASEPTISVIIAVRNGRLTLQRALDSVFEQTYGRIELIVMDGASSDRTPEILVRNAARIGYWESEPDRGVYHAWNKALQHATGEWICFLGADDKYHAPDVMARVANALTDDCGRHLIAYGLLDVVREDGSIHHSMGAPWPESQRRMAQGRMMIPHPATFHHRDVFDRHGRFDEQFRIAGDYEFLLRELLHHDALHIPLVVVDMAMGGMSDDPANRAMLLDEVHRARYMHGLVRRPARKRRRPLVKRFRRFVTRGLGEPTRKRLARLYRAVVPNPEKRR